MLSTFLRKFPAFATVVFLATSAALHAAPATVVSSGSRPFPSVRLPSQLRGADAVRVVTNQLSDIAEFYRKTPEQLAKHLQQDRSLWMDRDGRLFYVCESGAPGHVLSDTNATPPPAAIAPLNQTFKLHSKPGSTKTIFLDFDGHTISGTAWNANNNGGADIIAPPWDTDGNPNSFSNGELTAIQQIWLRVAEDFAPFDVDVTTEYPGEAALTRSSGADQVYGTRALVSAIGSYFGNPGGIAYVGVFDNTGDYYKPALVFPENLGNSEKNIAEAISHEVGHNLGLSHDGIINGASYYTGQGDWAPIMGVGYYEPISQWSKGEYSNANNTEDDLLIITQHGLAYRSDDHGNFLGNATPLVGTTITNWGIIERSTDLDFFSFSTGAGQVQFTVSPWERGGNLHFNVTLYDSTGTVITNREAIDTGSGVQSVAMSLPLSSGSYFLSIAPLGNGNPATDGYSSYGSLGFYGISMNLPGISSWVPVAGGDYSWDDTANWSAGIPNVVDANARMTNNILGDQTVSLDTSVVIGMLLIGDLDGSHGFTLENGSGGPLQFNTTGIDAGIIKPFGTDDVINASISLSRRLVVSNSSSGNLQISGPISGSHGLVKTGSGRLSLSGANTYSGETTVSNGALIINTAEAIATSSEVEVMDGAELDVSVLAGWNVGSHQTIAGSGSVVGNVIAGNGATVSPGSNIGTLTFSNNLTLAGGANLVFDLSPTDTVGNGINDLIDVSGELSLSGSNTFTVNATAGTILSPGTYTVVRYGSMTGDAGNLFYANPSTRYAVTVDDTTPGELQLHVTGSPLGITWRGDGFANAWDIATASNWFDGTGLDRFYQLDAVIFDDSGSNSPTINLIGSLMPGSVLVNASKNFTFAGTGNLTGTMSLTKQGSGSLLLNTANDFTGPVNIDGGIVKPSSTAGLGSGTDISILSGTLDLNGLNLSHRSISVQGAGFGNAGAIINSSAAQQNALQEVALTGDTTFGGSGRWDIRGNPGSLNGNGFKLTKTGINEIWLVDLGSTALGNIDVRQGLLGVQGTTTLGNFSDTLSLWPGTTLALWNNSEGALIKNLAMTNALLRNDTGANTLVGGVMLANSNRFTIAAGSLTLNGPVTGSGSIAKSGVGTLILPASNPFTGQVYIDSSSTGSSDGIVKLMNSRALSNASAIFIRNNNGGSSTLQLDGSSGGITLPQTINLSARNNSSVAIQSLAGTNTISGPLLLQTGGSNYLIQADAGQLNMTGSLPLSAPSGTRTITLQGAGDFLVSGIIQNGAGGATVALTKSGSGRLIIAGNANSYSGPTTVNAGTLQLGNGGTGGKLGSGPLINNGLLQFNRADNFVWTTDVSGSSGRMIKLNTNVITVISTNRFLSQSTGSAQVNGGTLQLNPTARLISNNEFWIAQNASTGTVVINGGVLISTNWIAVGRNSSSAQGTLIVNSGLVQKVGGGNIIVGSLGGRGTLTVNGGTVSNNSQLLLAESGTGQGILELNGGVVQASALTRFGGPTAIARFNGGTLQAITNNSAFISNLTQALVQSNGLVIDDNGFNITIPQLLQEDATSPGGGLLKFGNGMVNLTGATTFRGDTRILAGTLRVGLSTALQNSTVNLLEGDSGEVSFGTLAIATFGGLAGGRNLSLANSNGLAVSLTIGANGSDTVFSGELSGPGNLTKTGQGTLTLSGTNTFTGNTALAGGRLILDGVISSPVLNANFGTLSGNGFAAGSLTVQPAATLAPGNPIGALSIGNDASVSGTTILEIDRATTHDMLLVGGTLDLSGTLIITNVGPALAGGDSFQLLNAGTLNFNPTTIVLPELTDDLFWDTNQLATAGIISVIDPTPPVPPVLSTSLNAENLLITFQSESGVTYVLEATTNLVPPLLWIPQLTNQGDGSLMSLPVPIAADSPQNFFRLLSR